MNLVIRKIGDKIELSSPISILVVVPVWQASVLGTLLLTLCESNGIDKEFLVSDSRF